MRLATAVAFVLWTTLVNADWLDDRTRALHPVTFETRQNTGMAALILTPLLMFEIAGWNDKAAHCWAGAGSSLAFGMLLQPSDGWVMSIGIGAFKEYAWDERPDEVDWAVTAACGAVPWLAMETLRRHDANGSTEAPHNGAFAVLGGLQRASPQ